MHKNIKNEKKTICAPKRGLADISSAKWHVLVRWRSRREWGSLGQTRRHFGRRVRRSWAAKFIPVVRLVQIYITQVVRWLSDVGKAAR